MSPVFLQAGSTAPDTLVTWALQGALYTSVTWRTTHFLFAGAGPLGALPKVWSLQGFYSLLSFRGAASEGGGEWQGEAECVAGDMSLLAGLAWGLSANPHLAQSSWADLVPTQGRISKNKEALVWSFVMK